MQATSEPQGARLLAIRLVNAAGKPFGINPFPRAFANEHVANSTSRTAVFDRIYATNFWASDESRSGVGSESAFTRAYRKRLARCLRDLGATRIFDAPCGDLNWVAGLARDPAIEYFGGDISGTLIADLKRRYPDIPVRTFDICDDEFPSADIWHCRDCLFHLPFADIRRALDNFTRSTIPYALLTTHRAKVHRNLDVGAGGFRYLDLERAPIGLPPAAAYLKDFRIGRDFPRYVGLWTRDAVIDAARRW